MKKSRIDQKEIIFNKKLGISAKIQMVYSEEVVESGNSARINCKKDFTGQKALVVILPKGEDFSYTSK